jgi:hypothetical protein
MLVERGHSSLNTPARDASFPMKYYLRLGATTTPPQTAADIFALIQLGRANAETQACKLGDSQWSALGALLPALFEPGARPPLPEEEGGAGDLAAKAGHFLAEHTGEVAGLTKLFASRILSSNFTTAHASPEERQELEAAAIPVKSPMAQNYAAWRRAMLWFSGIGLALAALLTLFGNGSTYFDGSVPKIMRFALVAEFLLLSGGSALVFLAALSWSKISLSRKQARRGWMLGFFGPLLMFLLPFGQLITNYELASMLHKQEGGTEALTAAQAEQFVAGLKAHPEAALGLAVAFALLFAVLALSILIPRIFGIFPGLLRAALTLRTLVPESPLPGYIVALISPLYILLLMILLVIAAQAGSGAAFFGLLSLMGSPILLLLSVRRLSHPMPPEEMNAHLKPLRLKMVCCTMLGLLLLLGAFGENLGKIPAHTIISIIAQLFGSIFVLTVVASDFLLGLMKFSFDQSKALVGTPLYASMEQRYSDLAQVRLTQLMDEAAPPPPPPAALL